MNKLIALLALVFSMHGAQASYISTETLYNRMVGEDTEQVWSIGYVMGVVDLGQDKLWCIPGDMKFSPVFEGLKAVIKGIPEADRGSIAAQDVIRQILEINYKCTWA
jgi:hypothetical protein